MQFIAILFKIIVTTFLLSLTGLGAARMSLPTTSCEATLDQAKSVILEKMTYADVKNALGCDGVLVSREDLGGTGEFVFEDYAWRLDSWPYGRFQGHFINGVLHGTEQRVITLNLAWPKDG